MATDTSCEAGHRRGIATQRPRDLSMCTPRDQSGGDRQQQLGTFQVVGTGEGPQGETASAGGTNETGIPSLRVGLRTIGAVSGAAVSLLGVMVQALGPGAMRRSESVDSSAFHRLVRNAHIGRGRARAIPICAAAVYGDSAGSQDRSDRMRTSCPDRSGRRRTTTCAPPWRRWEEWSFGTATFRTK